MMLRVVKKDGQLRAAEKSPVVLSVLTAVSEVTDEDIRSGSGTLAGEWNQR